MNTKRNTQPWSLKYGNDHVFACVLVVGAPRQLVECAAMTTRMYCRCVGVDVMLRLCYGTAVSDIADDVVVSMSALIASSLPWCYYMY